LTTGVSQKRTHSNWLFWILALLVLVVLCSFAYHFLMVMTDSYGTFYSATDLADLDSDGDLDVLLHNVRQEEEFTAFSVGTLWFNQGDGQFGARHLETALGEPGGWASATGDVEQDGDADLFIFPGYRLELILNQGGTQGGQAGEFRSGGHIGGPERNGQFGSIILGDLNNNGQVDGIVVGCCGRVFTLNPDDDTPNVSGVWLNEWVNKGRLGQMYILSDLEGLAVRGAALGDLDGDGDLDIFAAVIAPSQGRNTDPADRVILNDGAGNFTDSGQRLGETDSTAVALGDLDGDGDLDALVGNESGAMVGINQGGVQGGKEGAFALFRQTISGDQTRAVFLSDLDEDGDLDALIGGRRLATIWWNDGQAVFTRDRQRFHYTKRHGLAIGDFNGDGRPDIFAAAYDTDYNVWFNQGDGIFQNTSWP
jgi:hypothetical protein